MKNWLKRNWMYIIVVAGIIASEFFAWYVYRDYIRCMPVAVVIVFAAWIALFAAFIIYIVFALCGLVESDDAPVDNDPPVCF